MKPFNTIRWKFVSWLTVNATNLSGLLLRDRKWNYSFSDFARMPPNSLGGTYYRKMLENNIPYNPKLIRHDMKHILLGYEMKMPDELRIHAFQMGNGSYNTLATTYIAICLLIVPEAVAFLRDDYRRGQKVPCLKNVSLEKYLNIDLIECRSKLNIS